jgi:bifunctional NMN adenylyltransferase/nudix hydrolase
MRFHTLVYIGRFQPLHAGHLALMRRALAQADELVLVLGSAWRPRSVRNPFSVAERQQMVLASLGADAARVRFVAVRDYYDGVRWSAAVRHAVADVVPTGRSVGLFGHLKDASSLYLKDFPDWPLVHTENVDGINAADLREAWFAAHGDVAAVADRLPSPVTQWLAEFARTPDFTRLVDEHRYLAQYRQSWASSPFAPVFVTVDAVVTCAGHVLMVQRGGQPGLGCWALPGGFLDAHERVAAASLRELREETRLAVDDDTLRAACRGSVLFDHPDRSARGRTLTHAFHYALPGDTLPAIEAADDAAAARWVPIADLPALEAQCFEDHFIILDRFLTLIEGA